MLTLEERFRAILGEKGIEPKKIEWLISRLTQEAKDNNDLISDERIAGSTSELLWYGMAEALLGYLSWESTQR